MSLAVSLLLQTRLDLPDLGRRPLKTLWPATVTPCSSSLREHRWGAGVYGLVNSTTALTANRWLASRLQYPDDLRPKARNVERTKHLREHNVPFRPTRKMSDGAAPFKPACARGRYHLYQLDSSRASFEMSCDMRIVQRRAMFQ